MIATIQIGQTLGGLLATREGWTPPVVRTERPALASWSTGGDVAVSGVGASVMADQALAAAQERIAALRMARDGRPTIARSHAPVAIGVALDGTPRSVDAVIAARSVPSDVAIGEARRRALHAGPIAVSRRRASARTWIGRARTTRCGAGPSQRAPRLARVTLSGLASGVPGMSFVTRQNACVAARHSAFAPTIVRRAK